MQKVNRLHGQDCLSFAKETCSEFAAETLQSRACPVKGLPAILGGTQVIISSWMNVRQESGAGAFERRS
jgi:hypothetical protein